MVLKKVIFVLWVCLVSGIMGAEPVATLPELVNPYQFLLDKNHLYVSQGPQIFIYSREDYHLVKKFGKEGEGPGEFLLHRESGGDEVILFLTDDFLIVSTMDKIVYFNKLGEFMREKKTSTAGRYLLPFGKFLVAKTYTRNSSDKIYHGVALYDSGLKLNKEIYQAVHGWQGINAEFNPLTVEQADFEFSKNRIFVINGPRDRIIVYDQNGDETNVIVNPDKPVPFTEKDRQNMIADYQTSQFWKALWERRRKMFRFPNSFPPIRRFQIDSGGDKLYLETFELKSKKDEKLRKWHIFDFNGKHIGIVWLMAEGNVRFYDSRIYRLVENAADEVYELHVASIN